MAQLVLIADLVGDEAAKATMSAGNVTSFFGLKRGFLLGIQALPFTPVSEELIADQWRIGSQSVIRQALGSFQNDLDIYDVEVKRRDPTVDPDNAYAKATSDYLICGRWPWGKFSTIPGNA